MEITLFSSELGLFLDFIGALFIGVAFFSARFKDISMQAETRWGFNAELFKSLVDQKFRGVFGTILLIVGFIFQFIGNLDKHLLIKDQVMFWSIILTLIGIFALWVFLFKIQKAKYLNKYAEKNNITF